MNKQYAELAQAIANQAQAIADGQVTGPVHAAVSRLRVNIDMLASWTRDDRSDPATESCGNARWDRLAATLAVMATDGDTPRIDRRRFPGGTSYSITIRQGDELIGIHDKWFRENWTGWQVHVEGAADAITTKEYPLTKKRAAVASHVAHALRNTDTRKAQAR